MSSADSAEDRADELTRRYRAASAADPEGPSDSVRESILAYAHSVAAAHVKGGTARALERKSVASWPSWHISVAASVIVAGFATLLAWHSRAPTPSPSPSRSHLAAHNPPATETPSAKHDVAAGPGVDADSLASSRQALARIAGSTAAENAEAGGSAKDEARVLENPMAAAQVAPAPAPAPAPYTAQGSRSQGPEAAASARTSVAPNSPLVTAAASGNLERVDQLLRSGTSTEQTDARGRTALLVATLRGDTAMVQRLLAAGGRPDAADEDGDTPLTAAHRQGSPELARLLERASHP